MNIRLKLIILLCWCGALVALAGEQPNVVVIFADDLGYGDLSCYGATKLNTPNIDRLAAEGRRFTDAHSASAVCTPSRYALITGRYPFRKGLSRPVFLKTGLVIDEERTSIADVMKEAGYATACIGKWHLGFGEKTPDWNGALKPGPLEMGFDYYYGVPIVNSHPPFVYVENHYVVGLVPEDPLVFGKTAKTQVIEEKMGINQIGGADAAHALYDDYAVGTRLAEKSVEWIVANKDDPFFLYLATTNIHHPFTPAKRFQGTSDCGLYGDFVHELDWIVGEVMATLEKNGLADNTLVIFTSDNGGMINLTGQRAIKQGHRLNGDLLGFKFDAWEGGHRVPFIARWPAKIEAGSESKQLICNVDLLATMAALTDQVLEADEGPDSFNVLSALTDDPEDPIRDHLVLGASKASHLVLREGDWVLIGGKGGGGFGSPKAGSHTFGGPAALKFAGQTNSDVVDGKLKKDAPAAQLYDLSADPSQATNVIQRYPERAESMRARLKQIKEAQGTNPRIAKQQGQVAEPTSSDEGPADQAAARKFRTLQLADAFHAESAALADIDKDGHADVVYGPFWFSGPDFKKRHSIYKPNPFKTAAYSNSFFSYADDLNGDGWKDVIVLGFPGREASTYWFKNPGVFDKSVPWEKFEVFAGAENESPVWADVDGDEKKEILCSIAGQFGFVAPEDRSKPELPWAFTPIAPPNSTGGKFTHGLGFGDVNGDGRNDLLEKSGWWEQPEEGLWIKHPYNFAESKGGSQMFAYDFDGDGDNDVVSALVAHGYGLAWFENSPKEDGGIDFKKHLIMRETGRIEIRNRFQPTPRIAARRYRWRRSKRHRHRKALLRSRRQRSRRKGHAGALLVSDSAREGGRRRFCSPSDSRCFGRWRRCHHRRCQWRWPNRCRGWEQEGLFCPPADQRKSGGAEAGCLCPRSCFSERRGRRPRPAEAGKEVTLALDGSYQHAFQDFLLMLAETKTQLPVTIPSKWSGDIEKNPNTTDPEAVAERIAAVKAALPKADLKTGRLVTETVCLTCHTIGGKGVGFSPPLDGSANRDLDGLITAIVDPNAAIENVFRSFRIETKDGTILEGFNRSEGRSSITLLSMGGAEQVVPIKNIKSAGYIEGKSVMPDLTSGMTPEQIAGIVAYLRSVK